MPEHQDIMDVLATIPDPEMPISIVDLGLVWAVETEEKRDGEGAEVTVVVLPTFIGCPALPMIEDEIREKVSAMAGVDEVRVQFVNDPPWSVDRITEKGRASLAEHGVTVPDRGSCGGGSAESTVVLRTSAVPCPFCGSDETRLDSPFGPTRCRMIYYCEACRNAFEHLKRV